MVCLSQYIYQLKCLCVYVPKSKKVRAWNWIIEYVKFSLELLDSRKNIFSLSHEIICVTNLLFISQKL